jgi:hypothetical protein
MAFDAVNNEIVLFGGHIGVGLNISTYGFLNQTWVLPGNLSGAWTLLHQKTPGPGPSGEPNMVYDPAIGKVVLMGGYNNRTILAYTWTFVNNTWTQVLKNGPPPARSGAAIDYDPALGGVVLFGGNSEDLYWNDVWLFTGAPGTTWTSLWAYPSPPHRAVGRGVYDPVTGQFVVFGGQYDESGNGGSGSYLNDTWGFQAALSTRPPYAVTGIVSTTMGVAISGAAVFANGSEGHFVTTATSTGKFSLSLENGTYETTATAPGYASSSRSVLVAGEAVPNVGFQLAILVPHTCKITGKVTDTVGNPIPTATISYVLDGTPDSVSVNPSGYFTVLLPNGTCVLTIAAPDYASQTRNVSVAGHNISIGRIELVT